MAWLSALLPADEATAVLTTLTAIADSALLDPTNTRTLGARRADALVDLATRWLDAGVTPLGPLTTRHGRRPHLNVTASPSTLLGLDESPGELAGYGPIPAPMARRIAARSTWTPLLVDARTGAPVARSTRTYEPTAGLRTAVLDRDLTCTFPGCRQPAQRCDLDHITPYDHGRGAARWRASSGRERTYAPSTRPTAERTTRSDRPADRRASRTCTPCAGTTTSRRPTRGGRRSATPTPARRTGVRRPGTGTSDPRRRSRHGQGPCPRRIRGSSSTHHRTNAPRPTTGPRRPVSSPPRPTTCPSRPTPSPCRPMPSPPPPTSCPSRPTTTPPRLTPAPARPVSG